MKLRRKHIEGQFEAFGKIDAAAHSGVRIDAMQLRGRLALASALGEKRTARLRIAETVANGIAREDMPYANPYAALIRAGIARRRGDDITAVNQLEKALKEFEGADMLLYATATRHRLGELIGGDRGRELVSQAEEWMSRQLIKNPAKVMNLIAPGFS